MKTVDQLYDRAAAEWVSRRFARYIKLDSGMTIEDVQLSTYNGGCCETCSYESVGISFHTVKVGKNNQTYRKWYNEELGSVSFPEVIREISEIIDELRRDD